MTAAEILLEVCLGFPVNQPLIDGNELKYLTECIETGWISSEGPFVKCFEDAMAKFVGRNEAVAVTSGTAALQLAFDALQLSPGSEVILPSFTIVSCASALPGLGLTPVFVDCDPVTFNMRAEDVAAAINERTRAVLIAHIYGLPADLDPLLALAAQHELKVIEDAAEAIGQTYRGKQCGSFGDISIFSFYPNKHITTGEGGMVLADAPALIERIRFMRNLSFDKERRYIHTELGWNYRMTNMQAALGFAQFEKLPRNVELKRRIGRAYDEALKDVEGISLPLPATDYAENIYWVYPLVLDDDFPADAATVMAALGEEGIGTRHFFYPLHRQPALLKHYPQLADISLPVSERIAQKGFYIPSGLGLDPVHIPTISQKIEDVLRKF